MAQRKEDTTSCTVYRWDDLPPDRPMAKIERRRVMGRHMMISHIVLERGFTVPAHAHANEQFAVVLSGTMRFELGPNGRTQIVRAGEVLHLPSNVEHAAEALERSILLDLFSPPSETTGVDRR